MIPTKRIQTCMGFDPDNKAFLEHRPEGASEFVNRLIKAYRDKKTVQTAVGNDVTNPDVEPELKQTVSSIKEELIRKKEEEEQKIRAYLRGASHILYMAKTQRKFTKQDLCRIKDELFFSKYNVDATVDQIRQILKSELDTFDVKAYEESRGILPKVE